MLAQVLALCKVYTLYAEIGKEWEKLFDKSVVYIPEFVHR
jgi:hypothetical protein